MENPSLILPSLDLREQEEPMQEELYDEERFVQLLQTLHERSILYHCPYDYPTLKNFYQQIILRQQTDLLSFQVVHQFLSELKQKNRLELGNENEYYETAMKQSLKDGIPVMSRKQFRKIIDKYEGQLPVITQILIQNSKNSDFVNCELVLQLLQQVKVEIEDAVIPELSITKLKTLRFNYSEHEDDIDPQSDVQLPIFQEIGEYEIKRLFDQYSRNIHRKLNFYKEFIGDQQILDEVEQFQQNLNSIENDIADQIQQMIEANNDLNNRCRQFNEMYTNFTDEENLQTDFSQKLKEKIAELKEQLSNSEATIKHAQSISQELEAIARQTQQELVNISKQYEQIEEQLQEYKTNYQTIYSEYEKLVEVSQRKSMISKEEENKKIFATRSLKEQLDDTAHKLNKILTERQKERRKYQVSQETNTNRIFVLQTKLEQLQRQLKQKNQYLCEYIRQSNLFNSKQSAFRMSAINSKSKLQGSAFYEAPQRQSYKQNEEISNERNSSRRSSIHSYKRFSKINKICIAAVEPIQEEQGGLDELGQIYDQQNIVSVIKEDNVERNDQAFKKTKVQSPQRVQLHQKPREQPKYKCFYSKGIIINIYGRKFETWILLTNKRFCYFDTKVRLDKYLPLQNIKQFIFTLDNPNLFIIKPTNVDNLNPQKHIVHDMIFSTRNISRLHNFVSQLRSNGEGKINVLIKKAENAWLKVHQDQYNLKISVPHNNNPYRLSLGHQNVFYALIKENGFISSNISTVLVIQPMGIICFKGEQIYELDEKRQLKCFLPLVEGVKITIKKNSKEAPDKKIVVQYKDNGMAYQFIFQNKDDTNKFKKAAETQLQKNQEAKEEIRNKLLKLFPISTV